MKNKDIELLLSKKTIKNYKKASKIILKDKLFIYAGDLLEYLEELLVSGRSWEMICQLFDTLGLMNYKDAIVVAKKICEADKDEDMITTCATKAYIRLMRSDSHDVSTAIQILQNTNSHSVREGVLWSLGQDRIIPSLEEQELLIKMCEGWENKKARRSDLRQGLAAACAGWSASPVTGFLKDCINSDYVPLKYAAEKALKKQYPTNW